MSNSEQLIPLAEVKSHLRLDVIRYDGQSDDLSEDNLLVSYRTAALEYVRKYCDQSFIAELPPCVKQACFLLIGDFYKYREETQVGSVVTSTGTMHKLLNMFRSDMEII